MGNVFLDRQRVRAQVFAVRSFSDSRPVLLAVLTPVVWTPMKTDPDCGFSARYPITVQSYCFNLFTLYGSHLTSHRCRVRCWVIEKYAPALPCQRNLTANKFFPETGLASDIEEITLYPLLSSFDFSHGILGVF